MTQLSPELQRRYGLMLGNIPAAVRKAIDSEELADRLVMADDLIRKSQAARTPAEGRALGEKAQRVLSAQPRAATERDVVAKMTKAAGMPPGMAGDLRQQARQLLEDHPPAVRRAGSKPTAVAKAAAQASAKPADGVPVIVLYDAVGNAAYAIDPDSPDLIPLTGLEDAGVVKVARTVRR
jgi:hypothetical protein